MFSELNVFISSFLGIKMAYFLETFVQSLAIEIHENLIINNPILSFILFNEHMNNIYYTYSKYLSHGFFDDADILLYFTISKT
jgi:hypothetical protein